MAEAIIREVEHLVRRAQNMSCDDQLALATAVAANIGYRLIPDYSIQGAEDAAQPKMLRVPTRFQTVDDVLGAAKQMELPNVLVLSELEDGKLVFLETEMTMASTNWLLDRMKMLILAPTGFERTGR